MGDSGGRARGERENTPGERGWERTRERMWSLWRWRHRARETKFLLIIFSSPLIPSLPSHISSASISTHLWVVILSILEAMASATVGTSLAACSKIAAVNNGVCGSCSSSTVLALAAPGKGYSGAKGKQVMKIMAAAAATGRVPDIEKRNLMNLLLLGALGLPTLGALGPYVYFFVPPSTGNAGAGVVAKDALGNDITSTGWLKAHPSGDRTLSQGLKGDPTYLVIENDGTLAAYGINAVCTHLGCVVPFNTAENKFMCPCHGSQYNNQGRVVRGPAPLSLALAHVDVTDDKVVFSTWKETDFRTGENPWWS